MRAMPTSDVVLSGFPRITVQPWLISMLVPRLWQVIKADASYRLGQARAKTLFLFHSWNKSATISRMEQRGQPIQKKNTTFARPRPRAGIVGEPMYGCIPTQLTECTFSASNV